MERALVREADETGCAAMDAPCHRHWPWIHFHDNLSNIEQRNCIATRTEMHVHVGRKMTLHKESSSNFWTERKTPTESIVKYTFSSSSRESDSDFCFRIEVGSDSERIFDENKRNALTSPAFIISPRCIGLVNIEAIHGQFTQFNNYS